VKLPPVNLNATAAIAFSGGGDSTALLHACRDNAAITHAFIIDHALRPGSDLEVKQAADFARSLGYQVRTQRWSHDGVSSAIQVKAREYRYAAMGEMCREENLKHLITAHTEDDQAETLLMRIERQTGWRGLAGMADAAYAPLWPALAGVTLHRPWLGVSRADIRAYNRTHDLTYIDDPSNENRDFTRVRARQALAADQNLRRDLLAQQKTARMRLIMERQDLKAWLERFAHISPHGFIKLSDPPPVELMLHILNAVSGQGGPIDAAKRARLCAMMAAPNFKASTLAGAWVVKIARSNGHAFVCVRDKVATTGRHDVAKLKPLTLKKKHLTLWDGRFFCRAKTDDVRVEAAQGHLQNLRQLTEFKALFDLPAEVRPTLPIYFKGSDAVGFGACETKYVSSVASSALRLQALFEKAGCVSI
jgi:tRNA(Ile)-lysidine synthase